MPIKHARAPRHNADDIMASDDDEQVPFSLQQNEGMGSIKI